MRPREPQLLFGVPSRRTPARTNAPLVNEFAPPSGPRARLTKARNRVRARQLSGMPMGALQWQ